MRRYGGKLPEYEITNATVYALLASAALGWLTAIVAVGWVICWIVDHLRWVP